MIRILTLLSILTFTAMLAVGQYQAGFVHPLLVPGLLLVIWSFSSVGRRSFPPTIMLIIVYLTAVHGVISGVNSSWIVAGCIFGTVAWDLDLFQQYLASVDEIKSSHTIVRGHLLRLLCSMSFAALAATFGLNFHLQLSLIPVLALVAVLLLALRWISSP